MKKIATNKSKPKLILFVIATNLFTVALLIFFILYVNNIKSILSANYTVTYNEELLRMINLESQQIKTAMQNDARWNDFVEFTFTKDQKWFKEMYSKPENYKADYIGAYDLDNTVIAESNTTKIKEKGFIPKDAQTALKKGGESRFYLQTKDGLLEVFGRAIIKSDTKNNSPYGYFFIARKFDKPLIKEFEKIGNSKITFVTKGETKLIEDYKLYYKKELKDNHGITIQTIYFERPFGKFLKNIYIVLYAILGISILFLCVSFFYIKKWIYNPLYAIRRALETGNKRAIEILKNTEGDFKNIGQLFEESTKQKKELIKEKLKAEESDKLKSAFLSNLSHEIRTPMNAIVGFTDLLIHTEVEQEEQKEYLTVIDKSGKNLIAIIDDLIEMSKIESHQTKPNYSAVNIETCIHDLYESIKITNKKAKKIKLEIKKANKIALHPIKTDETKLKQVITNLITNALKFTEKGTISFGYEIDDANTTITFKVKDTGFGINEKDQKFIFDRFRRVGGDQSIKAGGLGLGLAISKAYVEMLGGEMSLESKPNQGSTFMFTIPLKYIENKKIIVQPVNQVISSKGTEEGTILIAEDDNINFLLFQKIMKTKNYKIIRAENGQEAVDICLNNPSIDLVLMDIKMPIMDGYEAFEKIAPIRPNLPVIAQTAFSSNEDKEKIFKVGFTDYITKPINRDRLFELVDEVFKRKNS